MPTFRDLRFLPIVTKMRRFTFFAKRIAFQIPMSVGNHVLFSFRCNSSELIPPNCNRTANYFRVAGDRDNYGTCDVYFPLPSFARSVGQASA